MIPALLAATLAAAPAPNPPPPAIITTQVQDGRIDTRDLSWLRGALPDASPAERKSWAAASAWTKDCERVQTGRVRAELSALGVEPAALPLDSYGEPNCWVVGVLGQTAKRYPDWASFAAATAKARNLLDTLVYGAGLGRQGFGFDPAWVGNSEDAMWLLSAPVMEQTYRSSFSWRQPGNGPPVPDEVWPVLEGLLSAATAELDHRNTVKLKAMVDARGWPGKSRVGERASGNAWLLVQHADADPVFQLRALRLMEPMVATGEVTKRNYAYLYDRVMLKITGKQRYATQMRCQAGERVPQPLETTAGLDATRATMDLEPVAEYLTSMNKIFPPCAR